MQSVLERSDPGRKTMVPAGTVLMTEGTTSGRLYVLAEGSIEVVRGETQVAVVSEPGSFFGEMSVLLDASAHGDRARAFCRYGLRVRRRRRVPAVRSGDRLDRRPHARPAAQCATTYLVDLKRQYAGNGNHLGMVSDVLASLIHNQEPEFTPGSDRQPDPAM